MVASRIAQDVLVALFLVAPAAALAQAAPAPPPAVVRGEDEGALAVLAFSLAAAPVAGQLPLGTPAPGASGPAAVELSVEVAAREVTFHELPRVRTATAGGPRRATWRVERVNLPSHLEPGVVYRDVTVRLFLVATPAALDALLADARRLAPSLRLVPAAAAAPAPSGGALAREARP